MVNTKVLAGAYVALAVADAVLYAVRTPPEVNVDELRLSRA